jgi:hypothetical protein
MLGEYNEPHPNVERGPGPPLWPKAIYNFGLGGTLGHGTGQNQRLSALGARTIADIQ